MGQLGAVILMRTRGVPVGECRHEGGRQLGASAHQRLGVRDRRLRAEVRTQVRRDHLGLDEARDVASHDLACEGRRRVEVIEERELLHDDVDEPVGLRGVGDVGVEVERETVSVELTAGAPAWHQLARGGVLVLEEHPGRDVAGAVVMTRRERDAMDALAALADQRLVLGPRDKAERAHLGGDARP